MYKFNVCYLVEHSDFGEIGNEDIKDVIFPAGQMTATFSVEMINDEIFEDSETFRIMILEVSLPYGVVLGGKRSAVVTILDNDGKWIIMHLYKWNYLHF